MVRFGLAVLCFAHRAFCASLIPPTGCRHCSPLAARHGLGSGAVHVGPSERSQSSGYNMQLILKPYSLFL